MEIKVQTSIGNYTKSDYKATDICENIQSLFHFVNGGWISCDLNDIDFSDFDTIESKKGYVAIPLNSKGKITFDDTLAEWTDYNITKGTQYIAIPKSADKTEAGETDLYKCNSLMTIENASWATWSIDDVDFADFNTYDYEKGYLVDVTEVKELNVTKYTIKTSLADGIENVTITDTLQVKEGDNAKIEIVGESKS